jgi:hypothetical protein
MLQNLAGGCAGVLFTASRLSAQNSHCRFMSEDFFPLFETGSSDPSTGCEKGVLLRAEERLTIDYDLHKTGLLDRAGTGYNADTRRIEDRLPGLDFLDGHTTCGCRH